MVRKLRVWVEAGKALWTMAGELRATRVAVKEMRQRLYELEKENRSQRDAYLRRVQELNEHLSEAAPISESRLAS